MRNRLMILNYWNDIATPPLIHANKIWKTFKHLHKSISISQ